MSCGFIKNLLSFSSPSVAAMSTKDLKIMLISVVRNRTWDREMVQKKVLKKQFNFIATAAHNKLITIAPLAVWKLNTSPEL